MSSGCRNFCVCVWGGGSKEQGLQVINHGPWHAEQEAMAPLCIQLLGHTQCTGDVLTLIRPPLPAPVALICPTPSLFVSVICAVKHLLLLTNRKTLHADSKVSSQVFPFFMWPLLDSHYSYSVIYKAFSLTCSMAPPHWSRFYVSWVHVEFGQSRPPKE